MRGSLAQPRHAVDVAILDRGGIRDDLAQVATGEVDDRLAALAAQRVRIGLARSRLVAELQRAVAQRFPGRGVAALRDRAMQPGISLQPLPLLLGDARGRQQQRGIRGTRLQPCF